MTDEPTRWDSATGQQILGDIHAALRGDPQPDPDAYDCACCGQEAPRRPNTTISYRGAQACSWACLSHLVTGGLHR